MIRFSLIISLSLFLSFLHTTLKPNTPIAQEKKTYTPSELTSYDNFLQFDWIIIGGKPITLAAIGILLESGITPTSILWLNDNFSIEPEPSMNINNKATMLFFEKCKTFQPVIHDIKTYKKYPAPTLTPKKLLHLAVKHIRSRIPSISIDIQDITYDPYKKKYIIPWLNNTITGKNIILTSAYYPNPQPKKTYSSCNNKQPEAINPDDTIALIGSLVEGTYALDILKEYSMQKIIHFNIDKIIDKKTIKADNSITILHENKPTIVRIPYSAETAAIYLPECTKTIYCPSAPAFTLPELINTQFYKEYNDLQSCAPGVFILNPLLPTISKEPYNFEDIMEETKKLISSWLLILKK